MFWWIIVNASAYPKTQTVIQNWNCIQWFKLFLLERWKNHKIIANVLYLHCINIKSYRAQFYLNNNNNNTLNGMFFVFCFVLLWKKEKIINKNFMNNNGKSFYRTQCRFVVNEKIYLFLWVAQVFQVFFFFLFNNENKHCEFLSILWKLFSLQNQKGIHSFSMTWKHFTFKTKLLFEFLIG